MSLPIIGRERALADRLAKLLQDAVKRRHEWTAITRTERGCTFRVGLFDGREYTDRIAKVTIEMEEPPSERLTGEEGS